MAIHFLNCGSMRPYFPPVTSGITCLLVETDRGPLLVDTGLGTGDFLLPGIGSGLSGSRQVRAAPRQMAALPVKLWQTSHQAFF
jgi:glyoxylase-like metal-dependent hydrolase (beta-lactamase superfamily II)